MDLTKIIPKVALSVLDNTKLSDYQQYEIINSFVEKEASHGNGKINFEILAGAGVAINLFNDTKDDDEIELAKNLKYDALTDKKAILYYHLGGQFEAGAGFDTDLLKFGFNANQQLAFGAFHVHDNQQTIKKAVLEDAIGFKLFIDQDHVLSLKDNEALTMIRDGGIEANLEVGLSDVTTLGLSQISNLLNLSEALNIQIDQGVQLEIGLSIKDNFQAIVQRRKNTYWVSINKSVQKGVHAGVALEIGVEITNPEVVDQLFSNVLGSIEKGLDKKLDKVLSKATSTLNNSDRELLIRAAELLKLEDLANENASKLQAKVREKADAFKKKATDIVRNKVKIAAGFSYSRIKKTTALFQANFTANGIKRFHKKVVGFQLERLFDASLKNNEKDITHVQFEEFTELDIKKSSKFGFSIGQFGLQQKVEKFHSIDKHRSFKEGKGLKKVTEYVVGKSTYEQLGRLIRTNSMIIGATMDKYMGIDETIRCSDFDYDMTLAWKTRDGGITKSQELRQWLDFAMCWGIIQPRELEKKFNELEEIIVKSKIKKIEYEAHLKVPLGLFDMFIDDIAAISNQKLAIILAESVPYVNIKGRLSLNERRTFYTDFWKSFLETNDRLVDVERLQLFLRDYFIDRQLDDLAFFEKGEGNFEFYGGYSIAKMIGNNFIHRDFFDFQHYIKKLFNQFERDYTKVLEDQTFIKNLQGYRIQPEFNMRFMGRLLHHISINNKAVDRMESALQIKLTEKVNGKDVIIISK